MRRAKEINIIESVDSLAALLENERDRKRYQKLRFLYLLKTRQATNLCEAARILGENTQTVAWEWWHAYCDGGLPKLLEDKRVGNIRNIPPDIIEAVIENFKYMALPRSLDVQEWISEKFSLLATPHQIRTLIIGRLLPIWLINQKQAVILLADFNNIRPDLRQQFNAWKEKKGIPSDNIAMEQLIAEFFNLRPPQVDSVDTGQVLLEYLDERTRLPNRPYNIPDFLTGERLRQRLNVSRTAIRENRSRRTFPLWSKQRDPESIAWVWDSNSKRFRSLMQDEDARRLL